MHTFANNSYPAEIDEWSVYKDEKNTIQLCVYFFSIWIIVLLFESSAIFSG